MSKKIQIKQRDITDCGAACLASIAANYNFKLPVSKIRQIASTDQKGTNVLGMIEAAGKMGFTAKGVKGPIESLPKIPLPAIAHVVIKQRLQHYVVIYKVTKDHITVMDPARGKLEKYTTEEFKEIWSGVLILIMPNEDFKAIDEKVSVTSRLWYLLNPHKALLFQILVGSIIYTLLGLSTSIYVQKIVDQVIVNGNHNLLNLLSTVMIALLVIQVVINGLKSIFMLRTGQQIDARLILGYYKHLMQLPQRFFDTMRVGEIISRISDAVKIRSFINEVGISMIVNVLVIIFSFALMFTYYWKLALIVLIVLPLYSIIYAITNKLNKKTERRIMENAAELESQLVESITSMRTVKSFGMEDVANLKTETRFVTMLDSIYSSGRNAIVSNSFTEFISRLFTIILLWLGAGYVLQTEITPGELLSFYALIAYFTGPATSLIGANKTIQNAMIASDRLFEIMDLEEDKDEGKITIEDGKLTGNIKFKDISFRYGSRAQVFEHLDLTIKKGEITAVLGESGSGKTTIMAILQRLYPIQEGQIMLGDYDINYLTKDSLNNLVGIVPQKVDLFAGNVIDNIAIGDFNPDFQRIIHICKELDMLKFIEKLPNNFQTYLGENGASLSGGQKQRIAIARALYRNPDVLILDEATSALDTTSEDYVLKTMAKLKDEGKTVIMITHRLATAAHADNVLLLENGKLIEEGSYESLMLQKGHYYKLWQNQLPKEMKD
jgi:ATP-binding cassette subfamily B protein